jgi:hypothetical protein
MLVACLAWPHRQAPLFARYEAVRQALLAGSLDRTKVAASELANVARARHAEVAVDAEKIAASADLDSAKESFAALSDAMIVYRNAGGERPKPQVVYCSMARHSWLQPSGAITNPYYDGAMRSCGELKE